jgi:hypothetical protein
LRQPNHIILDFNSNKKLNSSQYWALNFLNNNESPTFLNDIDVFKKYFLNKQLTTNSKLTMNEQKFTIKTNISHSTNSLKNWEKDGILRLFKPVLKTQKNETLRLFLKYSKSNERDTFMFLTLNESKYYQYNLRHIFLLSKEYSLKNNLTNKSLNTWFNLVNINFLRKERLYTKLKYSRSPAYDIVSGGAAAILAGLLGFLISEKFGFELVDSGDFYYLFMYAVFVSFSVRPLLVVAEANKSFWNVFSIKRVIKFYTTLILNFFKTIKFYIFK